MADRKYPTSTDPGLNGGALQDIYAAKGKILFNAVNLVPVSITNSGNDYTIIIDPVLDTGTDVTSGMGFYVTPNAVNTNPVRMRVTSTGTYNTVKKAGGDDLAAGEWDPSTTYFCVFVGGTYKILSQAASDAAAAVQLRYQEFTSGGTWTKPTDIDPNAIIIVQLWGGGGGGFNGFGGGGGGGCGSGPRHFKPSDLTSTVAVTIGAAGALSGAGGNSSFGAFVLAFGGGAGTGGAGGAGGSGIASGVGSLTSQGGAGGSSATVVGSNSGEGGAGGGFGTTPGNSSAGGNSQYGGGGGGGRGSATTSLGGKSVIGGNGGNAVAAGAVPGGGGGGGAVGGAGKCIIRIVG